jgi:CBS domain-containing protein
MSNTMTLETDPAMVLGDGTAADLMTPNPISIGVDASIREAIQLLIDRGITAAPVIDEAGLPVGVLSRSDILVHDREHIDYLTPADAFFAPANLAASSGEILPRGFQVERVDRTPVRDLMTPVVLSVPLDATVAKVVEELIALKVHRLFVVDAQGVLVGVISALDVLRHLRPKSSSGRRPRVR